MPSFSFTAIPKKQQRTYKKVDAIHKIVAKGVEGVVFIDLDAIYTVKVNDQVYLIHPDNYTCEDKEVIYYQGYLENGHRVAYVRNKGSRDKQNVNLFLPFVAGCVVKGDIVRNLKTNSYYFDINKVYFNKTNSIAKQAFIFYKENSEIIHSKLNEKQKMNESR